MPNKGTNSSRSVAYRNFSILCNKLTLFFAPRTVQLIKPKLTLPIHYDGTSSRFLNGDLSLNALMLLFSASVPSLQQTMTSSSRLFPTSRRRCSDPLRAWARARKKEARLEERKEGRKSSGRFHFAFLHYATQGR